MAILTSIKPHLKQLLSPHINPTSKALHGGAKALINDIHGFLEPGTYVFKTDITSFYASLNHTILMQKLTTLGMMNSMLSIIHSYITRTILSFKGGFPCRIGIPKGGPLSPYLGEIFLNSFDAVMATWANQSSCFYRRYVDDIIIMTKTRHKLREGKRLIYDALHGLKLCTRVEKTTTLRIHKQNTFSFLGYDHGLSVVRISEESRLKQNFNTWQRYAQFGSLAKVRYEKRIQSYTTAGFSKVVLDKWIRSKPNTSTQSLSQHKENIDHLNSKLTNKHYNAELIIYCRYIFSLQPRVKQAWLQWIGWIGLDNGEGLLNPPHHYSAWQADHNESLFLSVLGDYLCLKKVYWH